MPASYVTIVIVTKERHDHSCRMLQDVGNLLVLLKQTEIEYGTSLANSQERGIPVPIPKGR